MVKTDPDMTAHEAQVRVNDFRAQQSPEVVEMFGHLFGKMIDVRFWCRLGSTLGGQLGWIDEKHVNDETTLMETVAMGMDRHGAKAAVYPYHGRWAVRAQGRGTRYYDTQEAAEMVAIHGA